MSWTEEHIEALRGYLGEVGVSFAEAAVSLNKKFGTGYSRNAIIGKCGREKIISSNPRYVHGDRPRKPQKPRAPRSHRRRPELSAPSEPVILLTIPIEPRNLTLLELGPGDCRWPCADDGRSFLFCGHPVGSGSYCAGHHFLSRRVSER